MQYNKLKKELLKKGFKLSTEECHEWVMPDGTGWLICNPDGFGGDHHELAVATGMIKQGESSDPLLKDGWIRYNVRRGCELWDIEKSADIIDERLMNDREMFGIKGNQWFFFIDERKSDKHYKIIVQDWKDCDFSVKKVIEERNPVLS